ncbi:TPA: SynChlorMet cassette protein ScmC [bacterium]|nr:SynChlorMet cassette protein ScmC [bacterium]
MSNYHLKLSNNLNLCFMSDNTAESWLQKFSTIMRLKPSESCYNCIKFIFVKNEIKENNYNIVDDLGLSYKFDLPNSDWKLWYYHPIEFWFHPDISDIICNIGSEISYNTEIVKMGHIVHLIYMLALNQGGIPLHSALIERHGIGVALAGPGGIGKSTCSRRIVPPWRSLCDDQILILPDKDGQYIAHPLPTWSDYLIRRQENTWNTQEHVNLNAIFFLKRAEYDKAVPVKQGESVLYINSSVNQIFSRNLDEMDKDKLLSVNNKLFNNICQVSKNIPIYTLYFSSTGQFWKEIETALGIV